MVNARRRLPARNRAADNTAKPRRKQYHENKNRSNERFFFACTHAFRGAAEADYSAFIPTTSPAFPSTTLKLSRAESAMAASMSAGCTPSGSQPSDLSM